MVTIAPKFQGIIPGESVSGAIDFLNSLDWNITIIDNDREKVLLSGDQRVVVASNEDELNSFVLGMAVGLAILPQEILEELRRIIGSE